MSAARHAGAVDDSAGLSVPAVVDFGADDGPPQAASSRPAIGRTVIIRSRIPRRTAGFGRG
jgi:hypothetical protein